jgi:hypothetical protein
LDGPEFPEPLTYLFERFNMLNGMRGEGMSGPGAFTPDFIKAADDLFDWGLQPHEVEALAQLDLTWRIAIRPDAPVTQPVKQQQDAPWPTRKAI